MIVCRICGQPACSSYYYCYNHIPHKPIKGISEDQFPPQTELERRGVIKVKDPQHWVKQKAYLESLNRRFAKMQKS